MCVFPRRAEHLLVNGPPAWHGQKHASKHHQRHKNGLLKLGLLTIDTHRFHIEEKFHYQRVDCAHDDPLGSCIEGGEAAVREEEKERKRKRGRERERERGRERTKKIK